MEVYYLLKSDQELTQEQACERIGITPKVYRFWIAESRDALKAFNNAVDEVSRQELAHLLVIREFVQLKLIKDALNDMTDPATRLQIYKFFVDRTETLHEQYRYIEDLETEGLLKGPKLIPGESKFAPGTAPMLDVETNEDGSKTIRARLPDVLEGKLAPESTNPEDRLDPI
jgi:hypothetical protein